MSRILISGASGLIGSALTGSLAAQGDNVVRLVRRRPRSGNELRWNPTAPIAPGLLSGFDIVIHLSGENIAARWTEEKKRRIRETRVFSTDFLAQALAKAEQRPQTFICASAVGYYGNRGDEILTEDSPSGEGFFPEVCREWEFATKPASDAGIRVVNLRTGIVLSHSGGALKQMLLPFKLGLGGRIGNGKQYWSWIHVDDFVAAVQHILNQTKDMGGRAPVLSEVEGSSPVQNQGKTVSLVQLSGPVNMTAPNPVTNAEFTEVLAEKLRRPAVLPLPAFAARLAFGELADEGLLASARVLPKKLLEARFAFRFPEVRAALGALLQP